MTDTVLGKIQSITIENAEGRFGIYVTLVGESTGVQDSKTIWTSNLKDDPIDSATSRRISEVFSWLYGLMDAAKVSNFNDLQNVPVMITYEDNLLKSWRILTEVI